MSNRTVYHVTYRSADDKWQVKIAGSANVISTDDTKAEAVEAAKRYAKNNKPSQVVVHLMDGTIETEYTYQDDPVRYPG